MATLLALFVLLVPFIVVFVFTYQAYKTAVRYEKNAAFWALAVFATGVGLYFFVQIFVGIVMVIYHVVNGQNPSPIDMSVGMSLLLWLVSIIVSSIGMVFLIGRISKVLDDSRGAELPPPPKF